MDATLFEAIVVAGIALITTLIGWSNHKNKAIGVIRLEQELAQEDMDDAAQEMAVETARAVQTGTSNGKLSDAILNFEKAQKIYKDLKNANHKKLLKWYSRRGDINV